MRHTEGFFIVLPQQRAQDMRLIDDICHGLHLLDLPGVTRRHPTTAPGHAPADDVVVRETLGALLAAAIARGVSDPVPRAWRIAQRAHMDPEERARALSEGHRLLSTPRPARRSWSGVTLLDSPKIISEQVQVSLAQVLVTAEYGGSPPAQLLLQAAAEVERRFEQARSWAEARRACGYG